MEEITLIKEKDGKEIVFNSYIPIEKTILLARENGLNGRLTVQHEWSNYNEEVVFAEYTITPENKIVSVIFPQIKSLHFPLDKTVPTKTEE